MVRGLYVAANSLLVQEACHDTIATNLANVSTPGYRRAVTSVESFPVLLGRASRVLAGSDQAVPHLSARQTTDFAPGMQQPTGNPCDLALDGPGFFVVQTASGEAYTRSGSFTLDPEGYVATSGGRRLLGEAGAIRVSGRSWSITPRGEVISNGEVIDRIRVVDFDAGGELSRLGDNLFSAGRAAPVAKESFYIRQGYIEGSNVNAVSEMVNMIAAMRAFEANQKMIQAMDQTLDKAVNEVGRV
jgi:flagellar basal-body rod protein FlgG